MSTSSDTDLGIVHIKQNIIQVETRKFVSSEIMRLFGENEEYQHLIPVITAYLVNEQKPYYATTLEGQEWQEQAVKKILPLYPQKIIDFINCFGDEYKDENIFTEVNIMEKSVTEKVSRLMSLNGSRLKRYRGRINVVEIEAYILNQLQNLYAATYKDLNQMTIELNSKSSWSRTLFDVALNRSINHVLLKDRLVAEVQKERDLEANKQKVKTKGFTDAYLQ